MMKLHKVEPVPEKFVYVEAGDRYFWIDGDGDIACSDVSPGDSLEDAYADNWIGRASGLDDIIEGLTALRDEIQPKPVRKTTKKATARKATRKRARHAS